MLTLSRLYPSKFIINNFHIQYLRLFYFTKKAPERLGVQGLLLLFLLFHKLLDCNQ